MQTIIGSGGAIGKELALALGDFTKDIRLVSRKPAKVNLSDQLVSANALDSADMLGAIEGSTVVYLVIGLPYDIKVWREEWPKVMTNVIEGCLKTKAKLVFLDNIYMYDRDFLGGMTEETPIRPTSKKGEVRAALVDMIMDRVHKGDLSALIARSADFYGPGIRNTSMLNETVIKPLSQGKKANWLGAAAYRHSFTYTPDAGRATALLGNTDDAYNQTWHLPTAENPFTGKEWVENIANTLDVKSGFHIVPKFMVRGIGLFNPIMKEIAEMMYQYDREYVFNSGKFAKRFSFEATPYLTGIREVVNADYPPNL